MNLDYIEEEHAVDVLRVSNEGRRKYTWHRPNQAGKIFNLISQNVTDA